MKPLAYTPRQYREHRAYFYESRFFVDERVLIPRPETELLVETASASIRSISEAASQRPAAVLDLCTGSGNIAISLTRSLSLDTIEASDISDEALSVAKTNAALHGLARRIRFVQSDLFEHIDGIFDVIVANPPYVAEEEFKALPKEVLVEPRIALDGGPGGLRCIGNIIEAAPRHLRPGGLLIMEMAYDQSARVASLINGSEHLCLEKIHRDYQHINRIVVARNNG